MKDSRLDDERLAALLDGDLSEQERNELLAELSPFDDDYQVLVGTAALLHEMEVQERQSQGRDAPPAPGAAIPLRPPARRRWGSPGRWAALAAGVAGIALAAGLAGRGSQGADAVRLAAGLEANTRLPEGWTERARWSSPRGDPSSRSSSAQAVQAGALLVDLAVAVRTRDAGA
ncbi:MAG TPA: hypothetical protein VIB55_24580, partial [Longimicrobium sp.]